MDAKRLGRRIKEARLAKKMTQAEVVGDFITRNMLSQIESGVATPSMKTLEFIAGVLDLSLPELMADAVGLDLGVLLSAKTALKAGEYDKVIEILPEPDPSDELYDELCALLARAYLGRSKLTNDPADSRRAIFYSKLGIYSDM